MNYRDGNPVRVGDIVRLESGVEGVVVFDVDCNDYAFGFERNDWEYLGQGVMIQSEEMGLIHIQRGDCSLEYVGRP